MSSSPRKAAVNLQAGPVWVVRVGGDDGELQPWHYTYTETPNLHVLQRHLRRGFVDQLDLLLLFWGGVRV